MVVVPGPPGTTPAGLFFWQFTSRRGAPVREDFTDKRKDLCVRLAPSVGRQLRFPAGFDEKLLGREMVLGGHLREQQAALMAADHQETVAANFDPFRANRKRRGEEGSLKFKDRHVCRSR